MPATESLTIEIQGDSSGLSQALDDALARVESLHSAADSASSSAAGIGGRLASVSTALQPLQQVGQQLSRISQQAQALSQQPITLNVQPALSALQSLMSAIQTVAAQLSAISTFGGRSGGGYGGGPRGDSGSGPRSSAGGSSPGSSSSLSTGMSSPMSAPYLNILTQSTFAQSSAQASPPIADASQLPVRDMFPASQSGSFPGGENDSRVMSRGSTSFSSGASSLDRSTQLDHSSSTINHFGGITIEVRETADVNSLMRDLRLQGLSTRHRQG